MKSIRIRGYSGLYFSTFGLNTERCGVNLLIQSDCGKIRSRITPNTDTSYADKIVQFPNIHDCRKVQKKTRIWGRGNVFEGFTDYTLMLP